jgi:hypothetical protein
VLCGKRKPASPAEALELAALCCHPARRLYAGAAGLYAAGFAADDKLVGDPREGRRYNAAVCALLAAAGQGTDAPKPDDQKRARLRRQALDWLRADLGVWKKQAETGNPMDRATVQSVVWTWQNNPGLASVRDKEGLAMLPDQERQDWAAFWANVEALRKRARETK